MKNKKAGSNRYLPMGMCRALAEELVHAKRPGDLNQALMELGATVCTMNPDCLACPVATHSLASLKENDPKAVNSVKEFPVKVAKPPPRDEYVTVCVLEVNSSEPISKHRKEEEPRSEILLIRRPEEGLLAGLWEFPSVSLGNVSVSAKEQKCTMDLFLKEQLNLDLSAGGLVQRRENLGNFRHIFSHVRWHLSVEWLVLSSKGNSFILSLPRFPHIGIIFLHIF
jgi:A/G-specific adenine glycosylase